MALRPPTVMARERILSYGGAGLGKSFDFYCIARLALKTKSDAKFYVIDTDVSAWRMLMDPQFSDLVDESGELYNIEIHEVDDWPSLMKAMETVSKRLRPQDWLMIDMISPTWDWCQGAFTDGVWGQGLDEYFLQARKATKDSSKNENAFEGWKDWPVINAMWARFTTMILKCKGNLYCTSEQKKVSTEASSDTKAMFVRSGGIGPVGQKRMPHLFQTVLWKIQTVRPGTPTRWEITTVKDRSRPDLSGQPVTDFAKDYLVKTAGWKLL